MIDRIAPELLDEQNPWPGLSPFDERGQRFFNGRRNETAALRRLVLQAPLTVLFAKSGLGKTSLLRAGLFPQLRDDNLLPVYVRLNVQDTERPLVEQLAIALFAEIKTRGCDAPPSRPGESLWRYLHRAGVEIWNPQNRLLTPFFVLDQFEEVFTLGAVNGPAIAQFRTDLADLVENRIPALIAQDLENSDADDAALDFARQPYKLLISFREDYLPMIEGWKQETPSLLRNRLRLLPLSGEQAFEAVHDPAPQLVAPAIAVDIVRFVAAVQAEDSLKTDPLVDLKKPLTGTAPENSLELAALCVEPALLSLVCHGLNERRKRDRKSAIDRKMIEETGRAIIGEFYYGCVAGMPDSVQRFIENELITEGGFRKPCAVDDARSLYKITEQELRALINQRLLRIEPYLGIERVELIHDVLTPVIRQAREQQRAITRQAAVQAEDAKRRQRTKVRVLMAGIALLVVGVLAVTSLAFLARDEANRAEAALQTSRAQLVSAAGTARLDLDPELATLLALESLDVQPTVQGESLLRQALSRTAESVLRGFEKPIRGMAYTSDGRRMATEAEDGSVRILDLQTGGTMHSFSHDEADGSIAEFSPDARFLGIVTTDGRLALWNTETGAKRELTIAMEKLPRSVPAPGEATVVAFDGSGTRVAAGWSSGLVSVWDVETGALQAAIAATTEQGGIIGITFAWDGRLILLNSSSVLALQLPGRAIKRFDIPLGEAQLNAFALSPNERVMAFAAGDEKIRSKPGVAVLVDMATGEVLHELEKGHTGAVLDVAFSRDSASVITAGADGTICIWDAETGDLQRVLRGHLGAVRRLAIAPTGNVFASGGDDNTVRVWPFSVLPVTVLSGQQKYGTSIAFSRDGKWITSASADATVRVWNADDGMLVHTMSGHRDPVNAVAINRDGTLIASAGGTYLSDGNKEGDTAIRLWNRESGELLRTIGENHVDALSLAFSPDGRTLASAGADASVRFWDTAAGSLIQELQWDEDPDYGYGTWIGFSPDGQYVALAASDGIARIWNYQTRTLIHNLDTMTKGQLTSTIFNDDGTQLLVTNLANSEISVWDVTSGMEITRFKGYETHNGADLRGDGRLVITADSFGPPRLWDVRTGGLLASLMPAQSPWAVAFGRNGNRIAATSANGSIYVWDCTLCLPISELREIARKRIGRSLTDQERQSIAPAEVP